MIAKISARPSSLWILVMGCHSDLYLVTKNQKNNEPDPFKQELEKLECLFAKPGWDSHLNKLIETVRQRDNIAAVWGIQVWFTKADVQTLYNSSDEEDREELQWVHDMNPDDWVLATSG